jgi:hypothetical protein
MTDIPQYRSAVYDALGRVIPDDGELRVWLDDDLEDRAAPEGWLHLITAREVCFLLLTGRIVELSLDNDLSDDQRYGKGTQVVDFLDDQFGAGDGRFLWPRDGLSVHSANPEARDTMVRAIRSRANRGLEVVESRTPGNKPLFRFAERERPR